MAVREICFTDIGTVEVQEASEQPGAPEPGEVALEPAYVGVCRSDLHVLWGDHPWIRPPVVTGHEVTAVIAATGAGVTDLAPGDRVLVNPLVPCGTCRQCSNGRVNTCAQAAVLGFRIPGAARTRTIHPAALTHRVPATLDLGLACLAEPLATAWHATQRAADLDDVLIIGGGTIGLSALLVLRARTTGRVTLVEPSPDKRRLAQELGADTTLRPDELSEKPANFTAAFDCVAHDDTLPTAIRQTATGGTVVLVGVPDATPALPLPRMQRFEIDLLGSGLYTGDDMDSALSLIADGLADVAPLVSRVDPLDEAPAAYNAANSLDSIKVLIRMR